MDTTSRQTLVFGISVAAIFVLSLVLTSFSPFESSLLVTVPFLFISTIFVLTFSKKKVVLGENPVQESSLEDELDEKEGKDQAISEAETVCVVDEYQVEPTEFPSDSESSGEGFELTWINSSKTVVQNGSEIAESSVSDEEEDDDGLIEISLPNMDSESANEDSKQKLPEFLNDFSFENEGFEELLAEIDEGNEEENLIEIDLSIGSIKIPSFEIEA